MERSFERVERMQYPMNNDYFIVATAQHLYSKSYYTVLQLQKIPKIVFQEPYVKQQKKKLEIFQKASLLHILDSKYIYCTNSQKIIFNCDSDSVPKPSQFSQKYSPPLLTESQCKTYKILLQTDVGIQSSGMIPPSGIYLLKTYSEGNVQISTGSPLHISQRDQKDHSKHYSVLLQSSLC